VSEAGVQVGVARLRSGAPAARRPAPPSPAARRPAPPSPANAAIDEAAVRLALAEVMDPELPMLSVVDLGIVHRVDVGPADASIRVEILPTFVGCPALELIKTSIATRLAEFGRPVEVTATFEVPWTSDRISPAGRAALLAAGIAPPGSDAAAGIDPGGLIDLEPRVPCPHCGSRHTTLENVFGPTQCRTIRYCADCRQPFEAIKPV
jgi:ring-1,2-phenylacetyl-CoA epoxidase subunit PaaD